MVSKLQVTLTLSIKRISLLKGLSDDCLVTINSIKRTMRLVVQVKNYFEGRAAVEVIYFFNRSVRRILFADHERHCKGICVVIFVDVKLSHSSFFLLHDMQH